MKNKNLTFLIGYYFLLISYFIFEVIYVTIGTIKLFNVRGSLIYQNLGDKLVSYDAAFTSGIYFSIVYILLAITAIYCVINLFKWKKWALWGLLILPIFRFVLIPTLNINGTFYNNWYNYTSIALIVILCLILQLKDNNGKRYWKYLNHYGDNAILYYTHNYITLHYALLFMINFILALMILRSTLDTIRIRAIGLDFLYYIIIFILHLANSFFIYKLTRWKKWAFWGVLFIAPVLLLFYFLHSYYWINIFTSIGTPVLKSIKVFFDAGIFNTEIGYFILYFILILTLKLVLKLKHNNIKAWDILENPTSINNKKIEVESIFTKKSIKYLSIFTKKSIKNLSIFIRKLIKYLSIFIEKLKRKKIIERYNNLEKIGQLFKDNVLQEKEFNDEKSKLLNNNVFNNSILSDSDKYEYLSIINKLYKKEIISKAEFEEEKSHIY